MIGQQVLILSQHPRVYTLLGKFLKEAAAHIKAQIEIEWVPGHGSPLELDRALMLGHGYFTYFHSGHVIFDFGSPLIRRFRAIRPDTEFTVIVPTEWDERVRKTGFEPDDQFAEILDEGVGIIYLQDLEKADAGRKLKRLAGEIVRSVASRKEKGVVRREYVPGDWRAYERDLAAVEVDYQCLESARRMLKATAQRWPKQVLLQAITGSQLSGKTSKVESAIDVLVERECAWLTKRGFTVQSSQFNGLIHRVATNRKLELGESTSHRVSARLFDDPEGYILKTPRRGYYNAWPLRSFREALEAHQAFNALRVEAARSLSLAAPTPFPTWILPRYPTTDLMMDELFPRHRWSGIIKYVPFMISPDRPEVHEARRRMRARTRDLSVREQRRLLAQAAAEDRRTAWRLLDPVPAFSTILWNLDEQTDEERINKIAAVAGGAATLLHLRT